MTKETSLSRKTAQILFFSSSIIDHFIPELINLLQKVGFDHCWVIRETVGLSFGKGIKAVVFKTYSKKMFFFI